MPRFDERFLLGSHDDAVHAALGQAGRERGGKGTALPDGPAGLFEGGSGSAQRVPDARGGGRAAFGGYFRHEDDAVRPGAVFHAVRPGAVFLRPARQFGVLAGRGGRSLDESLMRFSEAGGPLVQRGDDRNLSVRHLEDLGEVGRADGAEAGSVHRKTACRPGGRTRSGWS